MQHAISRFLAIAALIVSAGNAQAVPPASSLKSLQDIGQYVGGFPCGSGVSKSSVVRKALRKTVRDEYPNLQRHLAVSGCGVITRHGEYVLLEAFQTHTGGYDFLALVRESDGAVFAVWLKSGVAEGEIQIYGLKPLPMKVLDVFAYSLNVSWGHVACFEANGDVIGIDAERRANQSTGQCK